MERQKKGIKLKGIGKGQNVVDEKKQIPGSHLTVLYIHLMGYVYLPHFRLMLAQCGRCHPTSVIPQRQV